MTLEPLNLSMMTGRVAIAMAALSHVVFATFIVGTTVIGAATATIGHATRRQQFERLSHWIAFTLVLTTGTVSFLGVVLVFALNIFWPRFWHTIFNVMFWPFLAEAALFLGEAVFAYAWYYLWDWGRRGWRRRVHLSFIWLAAGCAVAAMFMIDLTASFMLTPRNPSEDWINILNPTMIDLHLHRWFGNITWAGFALAGLAAIAAIRAKTADSRDQELWAGRYCFGIGFGALLIMPVIGYQYMLHLRYGQPQAFYTLMLGERSWLFDLVALLYGALAVLGSVFIWRTGRALAGRPASFDAFLPMSLVVMVGAAVIFAMPYHIQHIPMLASLIDQPINPIGKMQPHKYFAIAALVVFGACNFVYYIRAGGFRPAGLHGTTRGLPGLLVALALLTVTIYLVMGWSRETARAANGYLLYGEIRLTDEQPTYGRPAPESPHEGSRL